MVDAATLTLQRALDMRALEHQVHASNIANANVPNYKAKKMDVDHQFREVLEKVENAEKTGSPMRSLDSLTAEGLEKVTGDIYEDPMATMSGIGNTVNMENEQVQLAKNNIAYETALKAISKKFSMTRSVLDGVR